MDLTSRCEDLQNRSRCKNLTIYRVPEGNEEKDMMVFVKELIQICPSTIPKVNLQIEKPPLISNNQTKKWCYQAWMSKLSSTELSDLNTHPGLPYLWSSNQSTLAWQIQGIEQATCWLSGCLRTNLTN